MEMVKPCIILGSFTMGSRILMDLRFPTFILFRFSNLNQPNKNWGKEKKENLGTG